MRKIASFPFKVIHKVLGIVSMTILGVIAIFIGLCAALFVVATIVLVALWILLMLVLLGCSMLFFTSAKAIDSTYDAKQGAAQNVTHIVSRLADKRVLN